MTTNSWMQTLAGTELTVDGGIPAKAPAPTKAPLPVDNSVINEHSKVQKATQVRTVLQEPATTPDKEAPRTPDSSPPDPTPPPQDPVASGPHPNLEVSTPPGDPHATADEPDTLRFGPQEFNPFASAPPGAPTEEPSGSPAGNGPDKAPAVNDREVSGIPNAERPEGSSASAPQEPQEPATLSTATAHPAPVEGPEPGEWDDFPTGEPAVVTQPQDLTPAPDGWDDLFAHEAEEASAPSSAVPDGDVSEDLDGLWAQAFSAAPPATDAPDVTPDPPAAPDALGLSEDHGASAVPGREVGVDEVWSEAFGDVHAEAAEEVRLTPLQECAARLGTTQERALELAVKCLLATLTITARTE